MIALQPAAAGSERDVLSAPGDSDMKTVHPSKWSYRRVVSFTFDDGLQKSTEQVCKILSSYGFLATFYVVTGWVNGRRKPDGRDRFNLGRSHGDWHFWKRVAVAGHEVGSHGFAHLNVGGRKARYLPWSAPLDLLRSQRDLRQKIGEGRYTVGMPFNQSSWLSDLAVRKLFLGCRLGESEIVVNKLDRMDIFRLACWVPRSSTPLSEYKAALEMTDPGSWLILQFHGVDDEGWEPVSSRMFSDICELIASTGEVDVMPVGDVLRSRLLQEDGNSTL